MLLRRTLGRLACLLGLCLFAVVARAVVHYDMTKEELLKELGKPSSTLKNPTTGREVLNYPKGVRIELDKGVVVSVKGLDMAAVEEASKAAAAEKAEAAEQAKIERELAEKAQAEAAAKAAKPETAEAAQARTAMEQAVVAMEKREAHSAQKQEKDYKKTAALFSITTFFIKLGLSWLVMVAALKLTIKYWSVDVDWSGLLLAAAAECGTRAVIGLIGEYVFHTTNFFYLDQVAATIVLVLVLRKVSTNQSLNQAVGIAMGVKVFSLVVGVVLFTLMLNVLH